MLVDPVLFWAKLFETMTRRYSTTAVAGASTQTAHSYRTIVRGEQRIYERTEPSLNTVLAERQSQRLSPEQFNVLFGHLPTDGEG